MTLENLLKIGQLKNHVTDATEVQRLLDAARRNLADAHVKQVSPETRFDAAYKAIMQAAHVALKLLCQRAIIANIPKSCTPRKSGSECPWSWR